MVSNRLSVKVLFSVLTVALLTIAMALPILLAQSYRTVLVRANPQSFNQGAVEALGGRVVYVAELAPVAVVVASGRAVGVLRNLPGVLYVSKDGVVEALAPPLEGLKPGKGGGAKQIPQTIPWGVEYINATDVWVLTTGSADVVGDGVIVGGLGDDAPEVISMGIGGSSSPQEVHDIIESAYGCNITIVAAAGNEGAESPVYPAVYPEVIAVGATDEGSIVPEWSSRNPELAAPGVDVLSTYAGDTYETLSDTSMAAPHASATVALMQALRLADGLPPLPPGTAGDTSTGGIRGILHITAADMGDPGYDSLYGYGVVNAYEAVQEATTAA
ncbi:MAG: S8 family serine peptidase [Desulfurococcales archaeon]|nr:S8 family serine peptidase [Desulfurococcales archaeon]